MARLSKPGFALIALADGAGTAKLAARGAQTTVSTVSRFLASNFETILRAPDADAKRFLMTAIQKGLLRTAHAKDCSMSDLACTLLFAATDGTMLLAGQLGDGRIGVRSKTTGDWYPLLAPDKGEFFNQTIFVSSKDPEDRLQLSQVPMADISACILMSDGAEESLFHRGTQTFAPAVEAITRWLSESSPRSVERALNSNLRSVMRTKTADDVSVALLLNPLSFKGFDSR